MKKIYEAPDLIQIRFTAEEVLLDYSIIQGEDPFEISPPIDIFKNN